MKYKRKLAPATTFDFAAMETWLSDMAEDGWIPVVYGDNVFEKCGINRDGAGEVGKPRYFNGKRHF